MRCIWNIAMMLLASYSLSATSVGDVSKLEGVTFSKINPVDSSLWVVTSDRGLLRLGRNLKAFTYKFPGDSVLVLDFDSIMSPHLRHLAAFFLILFNFHSPISV